MKLVGRALIEQGGLPYYIIYNAVPVIITLIYALRNGLRPILEILKLILIAIVTVTWTISFIAPEFYFFAFTTENFSFLYPFVAYLSTALIIYVYENYEKQDDIEFPKWKLSYMLRVQKYRTVETIFFCFLLTMLTVFLKEVYIMSGKIEISELALMFAQAGGYAGNYTMIYDFLFRYSYNNFLSSILFFPILYGVYARMPKLSVRFIDLVYFLAFCKILFFVVSLDNETNDEWFDANAIFPTQDLLKPPKKLKNIIFYQIESMDTGLSSEKVGGIMKESRIPHLENLIFDNRTAHWTHKGKGTLGGIYELKSTRITTFSTMAAYCSLPFFGKNTARPKQTSPFDFYEGYNCISDILNMFGYEMFVRMGTDYNDWGIGHVFNYHNIKNISCTDGGWTLDRDFLPKFVETLKQVADQKKPFFAHFITIDTHQPGFICEDCPEDVDRHSRTYRCADKRAHDFFEWCKQQWWYNNTIIVVYGDHNYRGGQSAEDMKKRVYLSILNSDYKPDITRATFRNVTQFDIYPTALYAAGFEIIGNRLGIGTNLFSKEKTILERYSVDVIEKELSGAPSWYSKGVLHGWYGSEEPIITGNITAY